MNPYSPEAVARRAASYREAVALRDRLRAAAAALGASPHDKSEATRADVHVRSAQARMAAMGDPLPAVAPPPAVKPASVVKAAPVARPAPAPAVDPAEALVADILAAAAAANPSAKHEHSNEQ